MTLTIIADNEKILAQQTQNIDGLASDMYESLAKILPPREPLVPQIYESLRGLVAFAVDSSVEMRTQVSDYTMTYLRSSKYKARGDIVSPMLFTATLMNECSGLASSNEELENQGAVLSVVLFPLVIKRGNDFGFGDEETVVFPAQVIAVSD